MKKIFLGLLLYGVMYLLAAPGAFAQGAVIRQLTGAVEIKAPDGDWAPAATGQKLEGGALISTGFKSSALIAVGNSLLTVRPLTRLSLEELSARDGIERININLRAGRIRADVEPPVGMNTEFTIRSPMAVASVRGTSFEFDGIRLQVAEGRVHISGKDTSGTYVSAGHGVSTDTETGKTAGVAESAREELALRPPAGMDRISEVKAAPPQVEDVEVGVKWIPE
jgi:hypothetical protein